MVYAIPEYGRKNISSRAVSATQISSKMTWAMWDPVSNIQTEQGMRSQPILHNYKCVIPRNGHSLEILDTIFSMYPKVTFIEFSNLWYPYLLFLFGCSVIKGMYQNILMIMN